MTSLHSQLEAVQRHLTAIQKRLEDPACVEGVFVVGCPRSGTSALSWALSEHPAFMTGPESNFLYTLVDSHGLRAAYESGTARPDLWLRTCGIDYAEFAAAIGFGVHSLFASRSLGKRWVDSSTENLLIADELSIIFPRARFLCVVRDGREVVASMLNSGFGPEWTRDFATACRTWVEFISAGDTFMATHPGRMLELRNETMAEDSDRMLDFLGEAADEDVARFLRDRRINSSFGAGPKVPQSKQAARDAAWSSWSEEQRALFEEIAGPTLRRLGYSDGGE